MSDTFFRGAKIRAGNNAPFARDELTTEECIFVLVDVAKHDKRIVTGSQLGELVLQAWNVYYRLEQKP